MSPNTLYRTSGAALIFGSLFGLAWTIMSALILPITNPDQFASLPFLLTSLIMLIASMALIAGLVGMYARQASQAGWLGFAGFILTFFGLLIVGVGFGLISATVIPWLTTHAPNLIAGELPPVLNAFIIVAILMVVAGAILLGVATMRTAILPRWAGLLLIVSGVASVIAIAPLPALARNILAGIGALAFFLGLAWLGYALLRERERKVEEARAHIPDLAPARVPDTATSEISDVDTTEVSDVTPVGVSDVDTTEVSHVDAAGVSD